MFSDKVLLSVTGFQFFVVELIWRTFEGRQPDVSVVPFVFVAPVESGAVVWVLKEALFSAVKVFVPINGWCSRSSNNRRQSFSCSSNGRTLDVYTKS